MPKRDVNSLEDFYQTSIMLPRVDFRADDFNTLIHQKGFRVKWEQSMYCSCYTQSGQPSYNCPVCSGKGYVYFDPKVTRSMVTSIRGNKKIEDIGLDDKGSAYLTPKSSDNVGFRDKFTFLDFSMKYSEVLPIEGEPRLTRLRYPCLSIIRVQDLEKSYLEGVDFNISSDKMNLEWVSENNKPESNYSVLYNTRPVYIALGPVHELRGTYSMHKGQGKEYFVVLPKQFQIKREDFLTPDDLRF